eukprot:7810158-Alexandrium_andersonii.AAC.1
MLLGPSHGPGAGRACRSFLEACLPPHPAGPREGPDWEQLPAACRGQHSGQRSGRWGGRPAPL